MSGDCIQPKELLELVDKALKLNQDYCEVLVDLECATTGLKKLHSIDHLFFYRDFLCEAIFDCSIQHEPLDKMRDRVEFDQGQGAVYSKGTAEQVKTQEAESMATLGDTPF